MHNIEHSSPVETERGQNKNVLYHRAENNMAKNE